MSLFGVRKLPRDRHYWHSIEFWDIAQRRRIGPPLPPQREVVQVAMADTEGRALAVVCDDLRLRSWALTAESWSPIGEIDFRESDRHVVAVTIGLMNGRQVVVTGGTNDGQRVLEVWDLTEQCHVLEIHTGHQKEIRAIALVRVDGRLVAVTASADTSVRAWDLLTGRRLANLTGHNGAVTSVQVANVHHRPTIVSGSLDRTIRLWDLRTQECVEVVRMPEQILCMDLSDRGTLVFGQGSDVVAVDASGLTALTATQRPL